MGGTPDLGKWKEKKKKKYHNLVEQCRRDLWEIDNDLKEVDGNKGFAEQSFM